MSDILLFDATLRDGSHAIKHQLTLDNIKDYCSSIDDAGLDCVIVGHGNGLGASSLQVGLSLNNDKDLLTTAKKYLKKTKLGAYVIPGFGTIKDEIIPAIKYGVDVFKVGCHCTEADTTREHIEFIKKNKKEVYGVLMMYHMASKERILEEAKKMESYGADGVILMDSAGASTPEMVQEIIKLLVKNLKIRVGFHAHNNMGLAVSNAYVALQSGATIIDGTLSGFGAGAGNCPLEIFAALCKKENINIKCNLDVLLDACEKVLPKISNKSSYVDPISVVSGYYGVFSAFKTQVLKISNELNVNPRLIFKELGARKAVAGQEDMIIEIAMKLKGVK